MPAQHLSKRTYTHYIISKQKNSKAAEIDCKKLIAFKMHDKTARKINWKVEFCHVSRIF